MRSRLGLALGAVLAVGLVAPATGFATDFTVTNTNDSGPGSLRQAILDSNASANPPDTISFADDVRGTIGVKSQLRISGNVTINGPGADALTVSASDAFPLGGARVLFVDDPAQATISGLKITNGFIHGEGTPEHGGGILNQGRLVLQNSVVRGNSVDGGHGSGGLPGESGGGGIWNSGSLELIRTTVSDNLAEAGFSDWPVGGSARGGGIASSGELELVESTVSGNEVRASNGSGQGGVGDGGGIAVTQSGTLSVSRSTISNNTAVAGTGGLPGASEGAGVYAGGVSSFTDSTISGNTSDANPQRGSHTGGIDVAAEVHLLGVTIASNKAFNNGANIGGFRGKATLRSTIVSDPQGSPNCDAPVISSAGWNLDSGDSCNLNGVDDLTRVDPRLGPLQDNSGPTKTRAIPTYSVALDQGNSVDFTDQRGLTRPVAFPGVPQAADGADIGAFEVQAGPAGTLRKIVGQVDPDRAPAGERTCFHFRAKRPSGKPLANVEVHLGGKVRDTGRHGGATICKRFDSAGARHARLKKPTWETDRIRIKIVD